MYNKIIFLLAKFRESLLKEELSEEEKIRMSITDAHREWLEKEKYFNDAVDPDLVDFAIYDIEASKRKYNYLLKQFRKEKNM